MLQLRFEILRGENRRLEKEEVLIFSAVCVILHDLLIRMGGKRALSEDGEGSDIVMGLYEEENEKLAQSTLQGNASKMTHRESVSDTVEAEAESIMVREFGFTGQPCFRSLQNELV